MNEEAVEQAVVRYALDRGYLAPEAVERARRQRAASSADGRGPLLPLLRPSLAPAQLQELTHVYRSLASRAPGSSDPRASTHPDASRASPGWAAAYAETAEVPPPSPSPLPGGSTGGLGRSSAGGGSSRTSGPLAPGARVGAYVIERELARGGMGAVYVARHVELGRQVALKLLLSEQGVDPQALLRFKLEAEASAALRHPNVVTVHEAGESGGNPYLVLDLIEGESLQARLSREGPLPVEEAVAAAVTLCDALEHAHARGILHRDLKPANVLLSREGRLLLTDFGLAKALDAGERLTQTGELLGTPGFMPPEQTDAKRGDMGPPADVYALGATLYALLTGQPPFTGSTALKVIADLLSIDAAPPSRLRPGLDPALDAVCLRCLEKLPTARYPTAAALRDDLQRWERGEPVEARAPGRAARAGRWARRHRSLLGIAGAGLALLAGLGTWYGVASPIGAPTVTLSADLVVTDGTFRGVSTVTSADGKVWGQTTTIKGTVDRTLEVRCEGARAAARPGGRYRLEVPVGASERLLRVEVGPPGAPAVASREVLVKRSAPDGHGEARGRTVILEGTVHGAGLEVRCGEARASVGPDARFRLEVPARFGKQTLHLELGTPGAAAVDSRAVLVERPAPDWYFELPAVAPGPLPAGIVFGAEPGEYRNTKDQSVLMWIPPGKVTMSGEGSTSDERPSIVVHLDRGFFLGRHELTWRQSREAVIAGAVPAPEDHVLNADKQAHQESWLDAPARGLTWEMAARYCAWAKLRLPTEAEWEYAARSGRDLQFPWGNEPPTPARVVAGQMATELVGRRPAGANAFGCLNLVGNVREWVHRIDWGEGQVLRDPPPHAYAPDDPRRHRRGGSFENRLGSSRALGVGFRDGEDLSDPNRDTGLRVAASARRD